MRKTTYWLAATAFLLSLCCCGPTAEDEATEFAAVLDELSIETDVAPPTDANGNAVDPEVNPYGSARTTLWKDCEVFLTGGAAVNGTGATAIFGAFASSAWSETAADTDDSWTEYYNKSVAADVDGDGYDEVIAMYYNSTTSEIAVRELRMSTSTSADKATIPCTVESLDSFMFRQDIDSGDIDGDGKDEIVLTNSDLFAILDDDYAVLYSAHVAPLNTGLGATYVVLRVALADFDGDGCDDVVLVNGIRDDALMAKVYGYSWSGSALTELMTPVYVTNAAHSLESPDVACGDVDGDNIPEIIFAGEETAAQNGRVLVMDTSMDGDSNPTFTFLEGGAYDELSAPCLGVACGDIDGDMVDEIVALSDVYELSASGELTDIGDTQYYWPGMLAVGDLTGDGKEDIVLSDVARGDLYLYSVNTTGAIEGGSGSGYGWDLSPSRTTGSLCLPDVDRDSTILSYQDHEILFTGPRIITVITAPPYYGDEDVGQNVDACEIAYGTSSSTGTGSTNSFGFTASLAVGYKFEIPMIATTEFTAKVEEGFTWGWAQNTEVTVTKGFTCGPNDDKVVFTSIPFDVYYYEILSSPDTSEVGMVTAISIPRQPVVLAVDAAFYNAHNGDGQDVDETVISYTRGDPWSYPTRADRDALRAAAIAAGTNALFTYETTDEQTVGQGTSSNTLSIEEITSSESSFEFEHAMSIEAKAGAFGAEVTVGLEMKYAYEYTQSVSHGTAISAAIGDISSADYADYVYAWGLMAYPTTVGDQAFTMVTCWVDEAG